jgi:hypothetical protein
MRALGNRILFTAGKRLATLLLQYDFVTFVQGNILLQ